MAKIEGTENEEILHGTDKNDKIYGYDGDDIIYGRKGNDHIYGGYGKDTLFGNDGNDHIYGNEGDNTIFGGKGNDILSTGSGFDINHLFGEDGNDLLLHKQGSYIFNDVPPSGVFGEGGAGNDTYRLESEWTPTDGPLTYRVIMIDYPDYESPEDTPRRDEVLINIVNQDGGGAGVAGLYDIERIEIEAPMGSKFEVIDNDPDDVHGDIEIVFNGIQATPDDPYWFT